MNSDDVQMEEACSLCGGGDSEVLPPDQYKDPSHRLPPLSIMLRHLAHNKPVDGKLCSDCAQRTADAYELSIRLCAATAPQDSVTTQTPLSDRLRALRRKLHGLTQKVDVFIVVGGGKDGGYTEDDIIMVEKEKLAAAVQADARRAPLLASLDEVQCSQCPMTFQNSEQVERHAQSAHGGGETAGSRHVCWWCGATLAGPAELAAHRAVCCLPPPAPAPAPAAAASSPATHCSLCNTTFKSVSALQAHCLAAHPLACPTCFCCLPTQEALAAHRAQHVAAGGGRGGGGAGAATHVCGCRGCPLRFTDRKLLLAHVRQHHGEGGTGAGEGGAGPARGERGEVPPETRPLECCQLCDRTFATAAPLKRHLRVHNKDIINVKSERVDIGPVEYLEQDVEFDIVEEGEEILGGSGEEIGGQEDAGEEEGEEVLGEAGERGQEDSGEGEGEEEGPGEVYETVEVEAEYLDMDTLEDE